LTVTVDEKLKKRPTAFEVWPPNAVLVCLVVFFALGVFIMPGVLLHYLPIANIIFGLVALVCGLLLIVLANRKGWTEHRTN